jgi:hypothetical protein
MSSKKDKGTSGVAGSIKRIVASVASVVKKDKHPYRPKVNKSQIGKMGFK